MIRCDKFFHPQFPVLYPLCNFIFKAFYMIKGVLFYKLAFVQIEQLKKEIFTMIQDQQEKATSQDKKKRLENIKQLLATQHNLSSAQQVCDAYFDKFNVEIPLPSMSRYLGSSDFERHNGIYSVALKDGAEKKSQILSNLLTDANAQIINDYDTLFISLTNDFSTTIAHYLETHPSISDYVLGIIPYKTSLMIFCRPGHKQFIEDIITNLISR